MSSLIEVRRLKKYYPDVKAVDDVSFSVHEGICFGLLGPNGAGKTTTLEIIENIITPSSGEIFYRGKPRSDEFCEEIGIQMQSTSLLQYLTTHEILQTYQWLYRRTKSIDWLIHSCELEEFIDRDTRKLSGGQKQRLLLALSLINDPALVFLDEPTTGLDPLSRRNVWNIINTVKKDRKTLILTTHYMEEAYLLCDVIAIMDHGKIVAMGSPNELLKKHCEGSLLLIPKKDFTLSLSNIPFQFIETEENIELKVEDIDDGIQYLIAQKISLTHLKIRSQTLDDLFLLLTRKKPL